MGLHDQIIEYVWSGITRYRCPVCPLDAETHLDMRLHINASHREQLMAAAGVRAPEATLFGADGALVTEVPLVIEKEKENE